MESNLSTEITLRVNEDMLPALDVVAQKSGLSSRSEAIEEILKCWHQVWLQHKIDRETVSYYKSLLPEELEEDRVWTEFASKQALTQWED